MARDALRRDDGFTLVEVMIATAVFMLILAGVFQIFVPSTATYALSQRRLNAQQNARVAMDLVTRQIRMAGYFPENIDTDPANDLSNRVRIASNAALAVYGDLDGSGASQVFLFCLSNGLRVIRGAPDAVTSYECANGDVMAESVTALSFAYFDANNDPVPSPPTTPYALDAQAVGALPDLGDTTERGAVRRIVVSLTARETGAAGPQTYSLTSDIRLRNP
jgi:type IV pilus assembly protein PilW